MAERWAAKIRNKGYGREPTVSSAGEKMNGKGPRALGTAKCSRYDSEQDRSSHEAGGLQIPTREQASATQWDKGNNRGSLGR